MFWADRIADEVARRIAERGDALIIRDEKTTSGRVHVGSMRGVAIHGAVSEALFDHGVENQFLYEFNDFDPMDDIPSYLSQEQYKPYLGMPLRDIPSPDGLAENFAAYFAHEFRGVIEETGWKPKFSWSSDLYIRGEMDGVIREALQGAENIRRIYREVSGSQREEGWLPIAAVCQQCKKISTTTAHNFDGTSVAIQCQKDKLTWTQGCGFEGRISPFGGGAKLVWKAEWAAKWKVIGVKVEGGGKDHSTKGGSRDVANHISREVFQYEPPFDIPYEFFLVGGRKMSSSKGRGSSAREIADLMPSKIFRLALLFKDINQAFNFDPEGDTLPILYDQYDKFAALYKEGVQDDFTRLFTLVHTEEERDILAQAFLPRFSLVAFLIQMPHLDLEKEAALLKGSALTASDTRELMERAAYARTWLAMYAPEKYVFTLQKHMPENLLLNDNQKKVIVALHEYLEQTVGMPEGEVLHQKLHSLKDELRIPPADVFSAVYLLFLGKSHGPKAGWFLSVLNKDFVLQRLTEATAS